SEDCLCQQRSPQPGRSCRQQIRDSRAEHEEKQNSNHDIEWKELKRENLALIFRWRPQPHRQMKAGNRSVVGRWLLVVGQNSSVVAALLGHSSWPKNNSTHTDFANDKRPTLATVSQNAPRHGKTIA